MADASLGSGAVEIVADRLYWTALHGQPRASSKVHYFSVDHELVYEPFNADFGPLNLSMVYRYCKILEAKLKDTSLHDRQIVHYCSPDPKKRANAAFLVCAFQVVALRKSAEVAFQNFSGAYPPFLPFRDATAGICTYQCTILDCLQGLQKSIEIGWFDWTRFDADSAEFFERVENGDMNWIIPDRMLAFAGPSPTTTDADGYPAFTPEDYVPIFRDAGIGLVVRLNKKQYERRRFIDHGIKHVDLYFLDGSCPSREIIGRFLHIVEAEPSGIAIHCKAGLGRTGTLIGLYAMKHFNFPARAWIGWNRICRPGSMLGPQQQFLTDIQLEMFQAGAQLRRPQGSLQDPDERALRMQLERMQLTGGRGDTRSAAEKVEDVGQGEMLRGAKLRVSVGVSPTAVSGAIRRGLHGVFGGGAAGR